MPALVLSRLVFLGVLLSTATAAASPKFSDRLADTLDLPCPPTCLLCHTEAKGGAATANTKFGITLRRAGLECCSISEFDDIIDELADAETDSDGDGIPDIEELRDGTDPNKKSKTAEIDCAPQPVSDGCTSTGTASASSALSLVIGLSVLSLARRRRAKAH